MGYESLWTSLDPEGICRLLLNVELSVERGWMIRATAPAEAKVPSRLLEFFMRRLGSNSV